MGAFIYDDWPETIGEDAEFAVMTADKPKERRRCPHCDYYFRLAMVALLSALGIILCVLLK